MKVFFWLKLKKIKTIIFKYSFQYLVSPARLVQQLETKNTFLASNHVISIPDIHTVQPPSPLCVLYATIHVGEYVNDKTMCCIMFGVLRNAPSRFCSWRAIAAPPPPLVPSPSLARNPGTRRLAPGRWIVHLTPYSNCSIKLVICAVLLLEIIAGLWSDLVFDLLREGVVCFCCCGSFRIEDGQKIGEKRLRGKCVKLTCTSNYSCKQIFFPYGIFECKITFVI